MMNVYRKIKKGLLIALAVLLVFTAVFGIYAGIIIMQTWRPFRTTLLKWIMNGWNGWRTAPWSFILGNMTAP